MRNYEKNPVTVINEFSQECYELCYTAAMPQEVKAAKLAIKRLFPNLNKMENEKSRQMLNLAKKMPDNFRYDLYSPYDEDGELRSLA